MPFGLSANFDNAGYLGGIKYPDNDVVGQFGGTGTALGYDHAGRLSSIPGILTSVTYNALGAPLVQTNANGTTTTKTYDPSRLWLTDIDTAAPGWATLQQLSYTLNASGMATSVGSNDINEQWTYEYDPDLNFLKSSVNGTAPGTANNQTWTYDNLGRFTGNSRVGTSYTYPDSGPTSVRPHAPTSISGGPLGTLNFSYDANGNLSTGNGRTMTWDVDNRITKVVKGAVTTEFTYGPDGTRIKKVQGSTTVRYPFGDDYEINGTTVTKYINAGFGTIAKRVGTSPASSVTYWLHADRLGSVNAVTDNTGAQVLRQGFRSYGEIFGKTTVGGHSESLDYIGERTDSETGLTYLHARYYDSQLGMFVSPDPQNPVRPFVYGFGDAVNSRDPNGLDPNWLNCLRFKPDVSEGDNSSSVTVTGECEEGYEITASGSIGWASSFQAYLQDHNAPAPGRLRLPMRGRPCAANDPRDRCSSPDDPPYVPPGGCGNDQSAAETDDGCTPAPIDQTCATEIIGVSCGAESLQLHPSVIRAVCSSVARAKSEPFLLSSLGKFRSNRPWDLKKTPGGSERLGNVNYGAIMRALGAPTDLILRGAGAYQWLQNLSNYGTIYPEKSGGPFWGSPMGNFPFGDDPVDQEQISQGIWLVDSGTCK